MSNKTLSFQQALENLEKALADFEEASKVEDRDTDAELCKVLAVAGFGRWAK